MGTLIYSLSPQSRRDSFNFPLWNVALSTPGDSAQETSKLSKTLKLSCSTKSGEMEEIGKCLKQSQLRQFNPILIHTTTYTYTTPEPFRLFFLIHEWSIHELETSQDMWKTRCSLLAFFFIKVKVVLVNFEMKCQLINPTRHLEFMQDCSQG